ncbi:MAG: amino acid carrier protein [Rickettsia sp.]|nr:amino acid carrier protein [Rickettsia sp.]
MFYLLSNLDDFFWRYIGWTSILIVGLYLTFVSKMFQIKQIWYLPRNIKILGVDIKKKSPGVNPFKIFFASAGGMVGLGNITGISMAIMIGGPGSIFWTFIATILGSLLKYSEIFIGVKYRVFNKKNNSFDGGPMYYLQAIFKNKILSYIFCILLAIYGIEIYQFGVLSDRITCVLDINKNISVISLIVLVLYVANGGVKRIANISSIIMPIFFFTYIGATLYIIFQNKSYLLDFIYLIFSSAFSGSAPIGGFVGSSVIISMYYGISKSVYSGDICIGYDSIMQSESSISNASKQGVLAIYALFVDGMICVCTNFVIGITGSWYKLNHLDSSSIIPQIFTEYFSHYSQISLDLLFFTAGFTTLVAFMNAGSKAAIFLFPKWGKISYNFISTFVFWWFSHFSQEKTMLIMSIISGFLVLINLCAIIKLRKEIKFNV